MWTIQEKTKKIQDNLIQMWTIHIFPVTPKIKKNIWQHINMARKTYLYNGYPQIQKITPSSFTLITARIL